jgi:hypothetical protein
MFVFLIARSMDAWSKYRELESYGGCKGTVATISHSDKKEPQYPMYRKLADPDTVLPGVKSRPSSPNPA